MAWPLERLYFGDNNPDDEDSGHSKGTAPTGNVVATTTSSILSIIGSILIFVTYYAIPEIRTFTRKLIVCLTVADILTATGYLIAACSFIDGHPVNADGKETWLCKWQSFLTTLSSLVSFFFTAIISLHILTTVVHRRAIFNKTHWLVVFNILCWGVPGVILATALTSNVLGHDDSATGPWCWISEKADLKVTWMYFTGKGWEISCYLITATFYIAMKFYLHRRYRRPRLHQIHESLRNEDANFLYVWFVLYSIRIWGTIRFIIATYFQDKVKTHSAAMQVLDVLHALGDPAQAFCNSILFCALDETVRTKICSYCAVMYKHKPTPDQQPLLNDSSPEEDRFDDRTNITPTSCETKRDKYGSTAGSNNSKSYSTSHEMASSRSWSKSEGYGSQEHITEHSSRNITL